MKIINHVAIYKIYNQRVFFIDTTNHLTNGESSCLSFSTPISGFEVFNNKIYISDWELRYLIFDIKLNILDKGINKHFQILNNCFLKIGIYNDNSLSRIILIDKNDAETALLFIQKGNYFIINENDLEEIFFYNKKYISLIKNNLFDSLWNFNLETLGQYHDSIGTFIDENGGLKNYEIIKFLGSYEDELLVALSGEMIIALNKQTGLVSRKWQREKILKPSGNPDFPTWVTDYPVWQMIDSSLFPPNYNWVSNMNPNSNCFQLDILSQMLYSLFGEYWVAIDLKTGESTFQSLKETLDRNHIKRFRASFGYGEDLNYVYTIGEMDEKFFNTDYIPQCLVAVNKETKQLDWVYRFENDGINLDIPQVTEDKVYQLSAGKNLYIFDKSEFNEN